jgi:hypothetical protein
MDRRTFVLCGAGLLLVGVSGRWSPARAHALGLGKVMTVYKSRTCGCCAKWVDHVRAAGFELTVHDTEDMDQIKDKLGVPPAVRSCHTALVGTYLIEGHVPAADIRRLLAQQTRTMGLAVPGMPAGTPGMAPEGEPIRDFEVVAFQQDGQTRTFARY